MTFYYDVNLYLQYKFGGKFKYSSSCLKKDIQNVVVFNVIVCLSVCKQWKYSKM